MLLYIMLYIMLAYIMFFAALTNAVCLHNALFLLLIFANAFCFHVLSWIIDTYFVYFKYDFESCTAFNLLVFSNSMLTPFLYERAMCSLEK